MAGFSLRMGQFSNPVTTPPVQMKLKFELQPPGCDLFVSVDFGLKANTSLKQKVFSLRTYLTDQPDEQELINTHPKIKAGLKFSPEARG